MAVNPYVLAAGGIVALAMALERLADAYDRAKGGMKFLFGAANVFASINVPNVPFISRVIGDLFGGGGSAPRRGLPVPAMANGGIVTGPTLALIGEAGPEAVVPLDRAGGMGGVTINVNGGDPEAVVNALRRYMNRYGNIPIRTVAP
jgi:SLT domain-containing protein